MELDEIIDRHDRRLKEEARREAEKQAEQRRHAEAGAAFRERLQYQDALIERAKLILEMTHGVEEETLLGRTRLYERPGVKNTVTKTSRNVYLGAEDGKYIFSRVYMHEKLEHKEERTPLGKFLGLAPNIVYERPGTIREFGIDFFVGDSSRPVNLQPAESYRGGTEAVYGLEESSLLEWSDEDLGQRVANTPEFQPEYQQRFSEALDLMVDTVHFRLVSQ